MPQKTAPTLEETQAHFRELWAFNDNLEIILIGWTKNGTPFTRLFEKINSVTRRNKGPNSFWENRFQDLKRGGWKTQIVKWQIRRIISKLEKTVQKVNYCLPYVKKKIAPLLKIPDGAPPKILSQNLTEEIICLIKGLHFLGEGVKYFNFFTILFFCN